MKITLEDLKASYRNMSDEELLSLDRDELTDMARKAYDGEMERRSLQHVPEEADEPATAEELSEEPLEEPTASVWVSQYMDDLREKSEILAQAGIPSEIRVLAQGALNALSTWRLVVPKALERETRHLLDEPRTGPIIVEARYENGVFKPIDDLVLPEGTVVEIHVPSEAFGEETEPRP